MGNLNASKKKKSREIEEEAEVLFYLFPRMEGMEEPKYSKFWRNFFYSFFKLLKEEEDNDDDSFNED
jgi:hypothetical protein